MTHKFAHCQTLSILSGLGIGGFVLWLGQGFEPIAFAGFVTTLSAMSLVSMVSFTTTFRKEHVFATGLGLISGSLLSVMAYLSWREISNT